MKSLLGGWRGVALVVCHVVASVIVATDAPPSRADSVRDLVDRLDPPATT